MVNDKEIQTTELPTETSHPQSPAPGPTPPSIVYPLVESALDCPWYCGNRDHRLAVSGCQLNSALAQIIELRGWLRSVDSQPNRGEDPSDWHYDLELDPSWTDQMGTDLHQLMRIGSILLFNMSGKTPDDFFAAFSAPKIHVELMSWHPDQKYGNGPANWHCDATLQPIPDPHWTFPDTFPQPSPAIPGTVWPWDPTAASDDPNRELIGLEPQEEDELHQHTDYVRIIGALISDDPHWGNDKDHPQTRASTAWGNRLVYGLTTSAKKGNPDNPSRWTEIHPPDTIEVLPYHPPSETVRCVAVIAQAGYNWADERLLDFDIPSPGIARPDPDATLKCLEIVGPETDLSTIVEGNADHTGAALSSVIQADGTGYVNVHVKVRGQGGFSPTCGQFKAIYRVSWEPGPPLIITVEPATILVGQQVLVTVHAEAGGIVRKGDVKIAGAKVGELDGWYTYTFHEPTNGTLAIPGYRDEAEFSFNVVLRHLFTNVNPYPMPLEQLVQVTVTARDAPLGTTLDGLKVLIHNGYHLPTDPPEPPGGYITGTPFPYIFHKRDPLDANPGADVRPAVTIYPTGSVVAPDYADASINFGFSMTDG